MLYFIYLLWLIIWVSLNIPILYFYKIEGAYITEGKSALDKTQAIEFHHEKRLIQFNYHFPQKFSPESY